MVLKKRQSRVFDIGLVGFRAKNVYESWLNKIYKILFFVVLALGLSVISFLGNSWLRIQFVPGTIVRTKVIAEVPFEYYSESRTNRLYEQKKGQASSVFTVDERSYDEFIRAIKLLDEQIENFTYDSTLTESGREEIMDFVNEFTSSNIIKFDWQDIALLVAYLSPIERAQVFQECISILREIAREGVLPEEFSETIEPTNAANYLGLRFKGGHKRNIRRLEGALNYARRHLLSMDIDNDMVSILFNIVKQGIRPNLVHDFEESKAKFDTVLKSIKPVRVKVKRGDVILEQGIEINEEGYEAINAYHKALKSANNLKYGLHKEFYPKMFLGCLGLFIVIFFYQFIPINRRISLKAAISCGILAILQLALLRICIQVFDGEIFSKKFLFICGAHFLPPALCGSAIAMLIYGGLAGIMVSIVVSIFYTLMVSRSIDFMILMIVSNLLFMGFLKNVNFRIKIARAGGLTGLILSSVLLLKNLIPLSYDKLTLLEAMFSFVMCVGSGILTVILFPIFEKIFSEYSNVTLLELTDYNNPLLKSLQMSAPGTYNHSLMVSNIAEQVAMQVNANSILCKTGALYHDVGKMLKSEYFIENQNNQINLHDKQTPHLSTLVIKNHVKDGIGLAKEFKLPPVIIDVIKQHHGTTLIQYFYDKAKRDFLTTADVDGMSKDEIDLLMDDKIESAAFRYDGPRPRSKEVLIVMLADSIEAASRSMKRVTHQAIETLVNNIFDNKLKDRQFDECPITFSEIRELKKAFTSTLLAMMHSRISYNSVTAVGNNESDKKSE